MRRCAGRLRRGASEPAAWKRAKTIFEAISVVRPKSFRWAHDKPMKRKLILMEAPAITSPCVIIFSILNK